MKIFKRILVAMLALLLISSVGGYFYFKNKFMGAPPNRLELSNFGQSFDFKWNAIKFGDRVEPHGAMFVPVSIEGIDRQLYMQFDMGANETVLTYDKILSIHEKYGELFPFDTIDGSLYSTNVNLKVGTVDLKASAVHYRGRGNKIDWEDTTTAILIGTIGGDFIEKNPLIIDYKNQKITLLEKLDESIEKSASFLPFNFEGRKAFLSAKLNDKDVSLWFDSGSSAFELIVDEDTYHKLAIPGAKEETFGINSWGQQIPAHISPAEGTFHFGDVSVPLNKVTYMDWPNKLQIFMMKASNIGGDLGGQTGNKLFLGKKLILDAPNKRFAVME